MDNKYNKCAVIMQKDVVTIYYQDKVYSVNDTHPNFKLIVEAVKAKEYNKIPRLADIPAAVRAAVKGRCEVKNGMVYYNGTPLHNYVADRILEFMRDRADIGYLLKFVERLMANPSKRAVDELYKFLEHKRIPIDEDGLFYAYKGISEDWYSVTSGREELIQGTRDISGRIFNGIGQTIEVNRRDVCDNANVGCSHGLHVGSLEYATGFGPLHVIVKVDPADVVSVPHDSSCQKLRCCKYTVTGKYNGPLPECSVKKDSPYEEVEDDWQDAYDDGFNDGYERGIEDAKNAVDELDCPSV